MTRFIVLTVVLIIALRMLSGRWPWDYFIRGQSDRYREILHARKLLGVSENAKQTEIIAAHKRLLIKVHPDRGGTSQQVYEANAARDILLNQIKS